MTMITEVFKDQGQIESIADAYAKLIEKYQNELYPRQKAAGSLGGASRSGFIKRNNEHYKRIR